MSSSEPARVSPGSSWPRKPSHPWRSRLYANRLPRALWARINSGAQLLVGVLGIDTQPNVGLSRFRKLRGGSFLQQIPELLKGS
jgi:hypothetical protein